MKKIFLFLIFLLLFFVLISRASTEVKNKLLNQALCQLIEDNNTAESLPVIKYLEQLDLVLPHAGSLSLTDYLSVSGDDSLLGKEFVAFFIKPTDNNKAIDLSVSTMTTVLKDKPFAVQARKGGDHFLMIAEARVEENTILILGGPWFIYIEDESLSLNHNPDFFTWVHCPGVWDGEAPLDTLYKDQPIEFICLVNDFDHDELTIDYIFDSKAILLIERDNYGFSQKIPAGKNLVRIEMSNYLQQLPAGEYVLTERLFDNRGGNSELKTSFILANSDNFVLEARQRQNDIQDLGELTNHPNPFNNQTLISYSIAEPGQIKLQIFNVQGQLLETLVDGWQTKGEHQVVWDAKNYASGIYFYRLENPGRELKIKSMTITK